MRLILGGWRPNLDYCLRPINRRRSTVVPMTAPGVASPPSLAETTRPARRLDHRLHALQIGLSVEAIRDTALSSPLWAIIMAGLFGGILPELGNTPTSQSWPWVLLCAVVAAGVFFLSRMVKSRTRNHQLDDRYWLPLVALAYFVVAASWCLVTFIFWEPSNIANHCFLLVVAIAAVSLFLTSRSGQFVMVIAATLPNLGMIWAEFLRQELWIDTVLAAVLPIWAIQLHLDSWRACRSVSGAHRTRLEMEALADELVLARDEASRANRAKSLFLANMSHELRTPLNAILGFSEVIMRKALGKNAEDRYSEYAGDILRSGRHLLGLINDVLDIAKIEAGKLELDRRWLDGRSIVQDCASLFAERALANGVTLRCEASPDDLRVFADERAFRQIVMNLVSNAVKYTPAGGRVEADLIAQDGVVVLAVRDTGSGIPADQLARMFQPFEQLDNRYGRANGGTGLGLTLVRALSELHGGHCRIESEVAKGTLVTVFLPLAKSASKPDIKKIAAA
jgi:two-component system cell cycle sensor histidine kinase PleC